MDCKHANLLMMQYMDDELSKAQALRLNKHLLNCEQCKSDFKLYEMISAEFDNAQDHCELIEAPAYFEMEVMNKVRAITPSFHTPVAPESLIGTICGIFAVLFGLGALMAMQSDAIMGFLLANETTATVLHALTPVGTYINTWVSSLIATLNDTVIALSGLLDASRVIVLIVVILLGIAQFVLYARSKRVEI